MRENKVLHVYYGERLVGTMALTESKKAAFEYADEWLADGFSISPFSLPLEKEGFCSHKRLFSRFIRRVCRQPAGCVGTVIVR